MKNGRPAEVNAHTIPTVLAHVAAVASADRVTVANLHTSDIHVLEGTAAAIWAHIDGRSTAAQISTFVQQGYLNASAYEVTQNVIEFLYGLAERDLIAVDL